MKKRDLISSLFFCIIGVIFFIGSFNYSIWERYGPGPGLFPLILGIIFSILSFSLFLTSLFRKERKEDELIESEPLNLFAINRTIIYLCTILCFYFLFDRLGFLLTILIFMLGTLILFGEKSIKFSFLISILTSLGIYFLFVRLLGVPLPGGILKNIL